MATKKHVGTSAVFHEGYASQHKLVDYVPAQLSSDNLDRVITHLLGQVVALQARTDALETDAAAQGRELARVHGELERANERAATAEEETHSLKQHIETLEAKCDAQFEAVQQQHDAHAAAVAAQHAAAAGKLDGVLQRTESAEQGLEVVHNDLAALAKRVAKSEKLFNDIEVLEGTVSQIRGDLHQHKQWAHRSEADLKNAFGEGQELLQKLLDQTAATVAEEAKARRVFEKRFETLDLEEFRKSLEELGTSIGYLSSEFLSQNERVDTTLAETTRRCDAMGRKLDSLTKQLHLRFPDFVDETDDTSSSILALLSNKVSDILSVLILFEAKVQKTEEGLGKLEGHLLDVLKAKDPRGGLAKSLMNSTGDIKRSPKMVLEAKEAPLPAADGILLGTKQLFKCLACNRRFKDRTPLGAMPGDPKKAAFDTAVPAAYYRSPRHDVKHGRAPLAGTMPPVLPEPEPPLVPTPPSAGAPMPTAPSAVEPVGGRPQSLRSSLAVAA